MTIEEELLIAYADGELDAEGRAQVERALADDPAAREQLERHRRLGARLNAHFGPIAEEPVPDRLAVLLKPKADIVDFAAARERRNARLRLPAWGNFGAVAASLAVGLLAGQMLLRGPVTTQDGALIARGELAHALDVRLASAQDDGSAIRIGVSFRNDRGQFCRSFDAAALSGIACRDRGRWQLPMTASPAGIKAGGGYRQAGSADALVMEAATAMMAGTPLDAETEQKARDRGWR